MLQLLYDTLVAILLCPPIIGFFFSGCPCCGCDYCDDLFTSHTAGTDINAGGDADSCTWTETAGSWVITAGQGAQVSTASAFLSTPDRADGLVTITSVVKTSALNDLFRIYLDYQDSNNYLYSEFKFGNTGVAYIKLGQVSGGVDSSLHSHTITGKSYTPGTLYWFTACLDGGRFHAVVSDAGGGVGSNDRHAHYDGVTPTGGGIIGVGTGGTVTGTCTWNQVVIRRTSSDCPACANCCEDSRAGGASTVVGPLAMMVTFGGIANNTCGTCTDFNAAFVCDLLPGNSNCIYEIANTTCGATVIRVRVYVSGTEHFAEGRIVNTALAFIAAEEKVKDNSPIINLYPCEQFVDLPLDDTITNSWGTQCTTTSMTATLTAVVT